MEKPNGNGKSNTRKLQTVDRHGRPIPNCVIYNIIEYRAAGIIPISIDDDDDLVLLLGTETRRERDKNGKITIESYLIDIGGRIEDRDRCSPFNTAIREFDEETENIFSNLLTMTKAFQIKEIWCPKAKYYCYLLYMEYNKKAELYKPKGNGDDKMDSLMWVKMKDLFRNKELYKDIIKIHIRLQYLIDLF